MIRKLIGMALLLLLTGCSGTEAPRHGALTLWYDRPASRWVETLPLGNGRLGAMPDGGPAAEHIVLNDISLWSGSEQNTDNPEAGEWLPRIRALLLEGRNLEAQRLMYRHFVCRGGGSAGAAYGSYQLLGALDIRQQLPDSSDVGAYERGLNIGDATAYTRFESGGVRFTREYFVSRTADVVAVRLRASRPGALNFSVRLSRPENARCSAGRGELRMEGSLPSGQEGVEGMRYAARAAVKGNSRLDEEAGALHVSDADEAVIYLSASTTWWSDDCGRMTDSLLDAALGCDFDSLREAHTADYRRYFDRVSLDLGEAPDLPTDRRLERFDSLPDPALAALYMQYGRYLLLSSTREGSLPPNLQGLWANTVDTPWKGDYHLNINVEMNHWLTGPGNLSELQRPLIELVRRMVPSGERTARCFYRSEGWCAHVLANPWNFTAPAENPAWGATNTGGAWLALHLWEQYRFTADTACLRSVYPVMRGAARFFLDNLIPEPEHGWLVTAPTSSPENGFYDESPTEITYVCMGSTMDTQLVRELFGAVTRASELLGCDADFAARLRATALRLPPHQVSESGYLLEWLKDYREMEPHHRHVSHLFGLYPGTQLTRRRTPELMSACRATLERRGDEGTGWSRAWKIAFWARLGDGNRAYRLFHNLLQPALVEGSADERSGTYPNLFCAHPPFQIDGNFGGAAGIAEMLLQSHDGCIDVLPALPDAWPEGEYRGLKARGNITVGCRWSQGRVREVTLCSEADCRVTLCVPGGESREVSCRAGEPCTLRFS